MTKIPAIAVIMPTYNSERYLRRCLDSFMAQTFDDWELVCVDRGSSDDTMSILREYAAHWSKLRILDGGNERTSQINIGVRATTSRYIYYTASDFDVDPTLLEEAFTACERDNVDGVYIDCISHGDHFWAKVRDLERSTYVGSVNFEAVRFFSRDAYKRAGGYDDNVPIFEEYDLQDRMFENHCRFGRIRAVERHLGEPRTLSEIWKKSYYYGQRYRDLVQKQGREALKHANPIRHTFFSHWTRFASHPILSAGFLVMLFAKYAAGALGFALASMTAGFTRVTIDRNP